MNDPVVFSKTTIRPHVVLLGAGASKAAFPNGDANGKQLPVMNDFVQVLQLSDLFDKASILYKGRNFEDVYTELHSDGAKKDLCQELEKAVYDYFSELSLPEEPTIYDYLILGLRKKDVIATFNWDPFLVQAAMRNSVVAPHPRLLFLHGNVKAGYCLKDKVLGTKGNRCSKCQELLTDTKLLYPIKEKNYESDEMLSIQWEILRYAMQHTFQFTVFGYSAPKTDKSALELLKDGWGAADTRDMEETEIIDIRPKHELIQVWDKFIFSHHHQSYGSFFDSWIARHPRRTGEAYSEQNDQCKFLDDNPVPRGLSLPELQEWFKELRAVELSKE